MKSLAFMVFRLRLNYIAEGLTGCELHSEDGWRSGLFFEVIIVLSSKVFRQTADSELGNGPLPPGEAIQKSTPSGGNLSNVGPPRGAC
jgi:hypothetical protein